MQTVLDGKLLVITGKGGVGKTTIAAATGMLAAERGRRTIVVELGQESRLPGLFGVPAAVPGVASELRDGLSSISIDPDRALLEWLQALGGRMSGRVLAASGTFQYFAAAAPGARELVTMVKVWQLTRGGARRTPSGGYDLVVLDAPATGHALGMLGSPHTFGAIARVGPIAAHTRKVQELLESPTQTAYLAVALATEMAVTEVLELQRGLQRTLGRELAGIVVNELLPRRFTTEELRRIDALAAAGPGDQARAGGPSAGADDARARALIDSATRAARSVHDRARMQQNQLARLRRHRFEVVGVPFVWTAQMDVAGVHAIARRIAHGL